MDAFGAQEGKGISCFEAEGKKSETRATKKVCKIQLEASGQVLREGSEGNEGRARRRNRQTPRRWLLPLKTHRIIEGMFEEQQQV